MTKTNQGLFINYRRGDSAAFARALYNALVREFGRDQVFMDVEDLREPGKDFVDEIQFSLDRCAAMLTLIGKDWLHAKDKDGDPRLADPADFVRLEIATALNRDVRVIPVLLEGARMPDVDELPGDLGSLARRQALKLGHENWDHDISEMVKWLGRIPGLERQAPATSAVTAKKGSKTPLFVGLGAGVVIVAAAAIFSFGDKTPPVAKDPEPVSNTVIKDTAPDPVVTPAPRPEPEPGPRYSADVQTAQGMLAKLDYEPGPADGYIGPATTAAIREFESDEGYRVRGEVTETLIQRLESAIAEEEADSLDAVSGTIDALIESTPVSNTAQANISGTWFNNAGIPVLIEQNGSNVRVGELNVFTQTWTQVGSGTFQNGVLRVTYTNSAGFSGTVVATLAPDGIHLNGTDTEASTGYTESNTWHFDHMPGN